MQIKVHYLRGTMSVAGQKIPGCLIMTVAEQGNHAIAMMTARCAQYVSALKIVGLCKRKISRRLRKNLHITILSLFCGEIIFEVFHPM